MKTKFIIGGIIAIILIITGLVLINSKPIYFKNDALPYNGNKIVNNTSKSFYDTILVHSLVYLEIKNQRIIIEDIDKTSMKGDDFTKGAVGIHPNSDIIFVFLNDLSKEEALIYIPHEAIHIQQYTTKNLINISENSVIYFNKKYNLDDVPYSDRPWEIDAFSDSGEVTKYLKKNIIK